MNSVYDSNINSMTNFCFVSCSETESLKCVDNETFCLLLAEEQNY